MKCSRGTILVVDEQLEGYQSLMQILAANDYEVLWARTANDGIRMAEDDEPDIILIDMDLRDISALDVCRNLRLRNSTWSIPIILVTSHPVEEADVVRGLELGANDCVDKPYKRLELLGRIGVLLRMKRVEEKLRRLYVERTRELEWSNMELQKIRTELILKNQMSRLGMMVAVIAHEVRSPAASISGNLEHMGPLLEGLLDELPRLQSLLRNVDAEDAGSVFHAIRAVANTNLREPPIDMVTRRRDTRALAVQLREVLPEVLDEATLTRLAKVRLGLHLSLWEPLLRRYGSAMLEPLINLGELFIKFNNMKISIERINRIVGAMKAYSHLDRQELQEVNVHEGLEDTLTMMNYTFQGNIEVTRHYASSLPSIQGYPGELNQVWTNLLQNAYDAMDGQRGQIRVETGVVRRDGRDMVAILVVDHGRGIPPEILPHIFDSFFTTKEKGKGSGLGLDICKQIVERHQGAITVDTAPGRTTFTVYLPLVQRRDDS